MGCHDFNSWYLKSKNSPIIYSSLQLLTQWGIVIGNATITLPISFKMWNSRITLGLAESNSDNTPATIVVDNGSFKTNSFNFLISSSGSTSRNIHWLTIGC